MYPETYNDCGRRIKNFSSDLLKKYRHSDKRTAHLVVTHGIAVKAYAEYINYKSSQDDSGRHSRVRIPQQIDYTGIASATVKGRTIRITLGGSAAHLKDDAAEIHMNSIALPPRRVSRQPT